MKKIVFLLALFTCSFNLSGKTIDVNIDGAKFKSAGDKITWQFYYSFPDTALTYVPKGDVWSGKILIEAKIADNLSTIISESWDMEYSTAVKPVNNEIILYGVKNFELKPGQYKVSLLFKDANDSTSIAKTELTAIFSEPDNNKIDISDIQIANIIEPDSIRSQNWNIMYLKHNLYVLPNPSAEIFANDPSLKLYYEIYNADKFSKSGLDIIYTIYDALHKEVFQIPRHISSKSSAIYDFVSLPLNSLATGLYYLKLSVSGSDPNTIDTTIRTKKFYLYNDIPPDLETKFSESELFEQSEFSTMTTERIDIEYKMSKIIAQPDEIDTYERLSTLKAKQRFLFKFWNNRDTDTNNLMNDALNEFRNRIEYANTFFDYNGKKEAWKTARGKVLIKYGQPTQREMHQAFGTYRAYEEWMYSDIQGGAYFYFVDTQGSGDFILVHSTARYEIKNPNWYEQDVRVSNYEQSEEDSNKPKLYKTDPNNNNR